MGKVENRLFMAELALPAVFTAPPGIEFKFDLVRVSGGLAYVSGHGPIDGSKPLMQGKVGTDLTAEQGNEAARLTALSIIASLKQELGDLDRVTQWVKVLGLVNCAPGFQRNARRDQRVQRSDPGALGTGPRSPCAIRDRRRGATVRHTSGSGSNSRSR